MVLQTVLSEPELQKRLGGCTWQARAEVRYRDVTTQLGKDKPKRPSGPFAGKVTVKEKAGHGRRRHRRSAVSIQVGLNYFDLNVFKRPPIECAFRGP